ncbi:MAG: tetratricopeptide repeat protein [Tepidisphaeraceae bacterium]
MSGTSGRIRLVSRIAGIFGAAALIAGVGGCADVITYAKDSERAGIRQYNNREFADAAGSFRNAIRQDPRSYRSHYYLGASYYQLGQYQQSVQAYKSALDTMRTTLEGKADHEFRQRVLDGLAQAAAKSSDRDGEIALVQRRATATQAAEDYFILAKIHRYSGDADTAVNAYNQAALLDPKNFYISKEFGLYLVQLNQPQRAEIPLRRAYQLDSSDVEVIAAMRQIGVVPGPGLKRQDELTKPFIPQGPIPELDLNKLKLGSGNGGAQASEAPAPAPGQQVQAPRD